LIDETVTCSGGKSAKGEKGVGQQRKQTAMKTIPCTKWERKRKKDEKEEEGGNVGGGTLKRNEAPGGAVGGGNVPQ